jgi:hypothetical protein
MKLYGKKLIKRSITNALADKVETRDAILWDVLPDQRLCRVKIQGSNTLVVARYPENWEQTPSWLKPRNAVRIVHVGGERGRIEVVGHGRFIPTPVAGDTFPEVGTSGDGILSGCYATQVFNNPKMAVHVHVGTFRIGGAEYALGPITMDGGDNFFCGDGGLCGDIAAVMVINAAPAAGQFRFDLISVGADSVVDYVAGTPAAADPVKPSVGAGHVGLAYVLVAGGDTAIYQAALDGSWRAPEPSILTMEIADSELEWEELETAVTLKVYDQYNHLIAPPAGSVYHFTLEISIGNGQVFGDEGWSETKVSRMATGSSASFTYKRDQELTDLSPLLKGTLVREVDLSAWGYINLYDESDEIMR